MKREVMTRASRVLSGTFIESMLVQMTQKKGRGPTFYQSTLVDPTKPGKVGAVALQVGQLQYWTNKVVGFRQEWKEDRANMQAGTLSMRSKRCDRDRWDALDGTPHDRNSHGHG